MDNQPEHSTNHWQNSSSLRCEERDRRAELYKNEMTFPVDYVPSKSTVELFINWARFTKDKSLLELMEKNEGSSVAVEKEILGRIQKAFEVSVQAFPFKCILMVWFPTPNVCLHPNYDQVFHEYTNKTDVRYVDIGCCMGTDLRYVCYNQKHNVKIENSLGLDIQEEFFDVGCNLLFEDNVTMQERFIKTNILDDQFVENCSNPSLLSEFVKPRSKPYDNEMNFVHECAKLKYQGTDIVYCGLVFHLLSETQTYQLSTLVYNNFLKDQGGIFFGSTVGSTDPVQPIRNNERRDMLGFSFVHSVESLKEMLEKIGFVNVQVEMKNIKKSELIRDDQGKQESVTSEFEKAISNLSMITWYAEKTSN